MPSKKEYNLIEAIEAVGHEIAPDVDIVTVKIVGPSKSPIVRLYIDYPGGVTFDILCETQKWVSGILDEINPFPGSYTLEVSSPGPDRPLRTLNHFNFACGKMIHVKTITPVNQRKAFTGTLKKADDKYIEIALDEGKQGQEPIVQIPFDCVSSANVKPT